MLFDMDRALFHFAHLDVPVHRLEAEQCFKN